MDQITTNILISVLNFLVIAVLGALIFQVRKMLRKIQLHEYKQDATVYAIGKWISKPIEERNEGFFYSCYHTRLAELIQSNQFINQIIK